MNGTIATPTTGAVTGGCRTLLRLEGLTLFLGMVLLYAVWGGSWWVFAVLFLVPDLSFAGLSRRAPGRRDRLQRRAQLHGADGADDGGLRATARR